MTKMFSKNDISRDVIKENPEAMIKIVQGL
jgi:hypothetical protein